jgi:hypothetical protein
LHGGRLAALRKRGTRAGPELGPERPEALGL